ncbi:alpha/beta hydrolase fold domain-containing protein [Mycolicibacterium psychrotolerans]|uniref:alpha/beta hydrolase fold domain-containing protein n=1 Tax=Mycolicibacterium psychrotolerans TaxID=216929 RepID=UPI003D666E28
MSAAQYVGRLGGLAVFFGVGTAVLLGGGTAAADSAGASGKSADSGRAHAVSEGRSGNDSGSQHAGATAMSARGAASAPGVVNVSPTIAGTQVRAAATQRTAAPSVAAVSVIETSQPVVSSAAAPAPRARSARATASSATVNATDVVPQVISPSVNRNAFDPIGVLATLVTNVEQVVLSAFAAPTALVGPTATPGTFTGQPSLVQRLYAGVVGALKSQLTSTAGSGPLYSAAPPWYTTLGLTVTKTEFEGMPVYTLQRTWAQSDKEVVYVHGGGYVTQPLVFQWATVADYARQTGATIVVPIYPLGGQGGNAETVVPAIADLMSQVTKERGAVNVSVLGDSAGGGLALAAVQEQIRRGDTTPNSMVLLSPWLDVTLSDPRSHQINDPLLDADALVAYGKLWADNLDPTDPRVSPLYGSLAGLPPTTVYSGSLDLLSPDTVRLQEKAIADGVPITFGLRSDSIHCWGVFPFLPEAQADRTNTYKALGLL